MRGFIDQMRECGGVIDYEDPVAADYDACRLAHGTDRLLLFHDLEGKRGVMNVTATRNALSQALNIPETDLVRRLSLAEFQGNVVCEGNLPMSAPDLQKIPVMKHFPRDAGKYITAGIVFSRYGDTENASIHRMQVLDEKRVAARLVEGRHTYTLHKAAVERGDRLPVAVAIGVHPTVTIASCTRVPKGKELSYAAELLGGEMPVYRCPNGVLVPDAEIVFEGYIGNETTMEGPFVDITGTYDLVREQPVIEFTGMHLKKDFIYHGILPGGNEHKMLMGAPYEPSIYRAVGGVTEVKNVVLTTGGCGYFHAVIQIRKQTQGDGKNAILAALASHTSLKHVVVVDTDINPSDIQDVEFAIATRVRGDKSLLVIPGARGSSLDPCKAEDGTNVKVGIDATMPLGREDEFRRAGWD
ncbi:MAG TPA: UbiD family decarboxylase [Methanoregulaceae archaeon]|nr:UbiD family decarboxylase [Methanoregulaceae archaeon]HPA07129.1 UbiD family decarboxylase [Methanoregulaceae archaeon]HQJ39394.1 UbiD family decarboxylase [Methanoregulaceae archaeon]HQN89351.1 UbiD family decarboxylase [Methanoregulaceae archaeon]HQP81820.1 UbiD family decarboxylase [Methanoregulaceae archaeon]